MDEKVLGCWPVELLKIPRPGSVNGHHCSECKCEIWVMPKNLQLGFRLICLPCAAQHAEETGDTKVYPAELAHLTQNN